MEVVVVDVVMVEVDVLGFVVVDGETVAPENQIVILVAVKGCRKLIFF